MPYIQPINTLTNIWACFIIRNTLVDSGNTKSTHEIHNINTYTAMKELKHKIRLGFGPVGLWNVAVES